VPRDIRNANYTNLSKAFIPEQEPLLVLTDTEPHTPVKTVVPIDPAATTVTRLPTAPSPKVTPHAPSVLSPAREPRVSSELDESRPHHEARRIPGNIPELSCTRQPFKTRLLRLQFLLIAHVAYA
jgi:hypothetical protein